MHWSVRFTRGYGKSSATMRGAGIDTKGTISKAIHRLEKIGLIKVYNDRGTRRYLLRDPRFADGTLYFTVRFTDQTSFCVRYACDMFAVGAELSDWQSGDFHIIREYMKPIPR